MARKMMVWSQFPGFRSATRYFCSAWLVVSASGCASPDAVTAPMGDPSTFFDALRIRETAVTLALGSTWDTAQLHVTATFADGSSIPSPVRYIPSDSTITVDSLGLITAQFPTTNLATVVVELTHLGLTRRDSVRIRVLSAAPAVRMQRLSITRPAGSSAVIPLLEKMETGAIKLGMQEITVNALDPLGESIPSDEILIALESSDTTIAVVDQAGVITARRRGHVIIRATALANGVFATDSIDMTVGMQLYAMFEFDRESPVWRLTGDTARIAAGGVISWVNNKESKIDVIFEDTTNIDEATAWPSLGAPMTGRGNLLNFGWIPTLPDYSNFLESLMSTQRARRFPVPGIYRFRGVAGSVDQTRVRGVILVCAASAIRCDP